MSSKVHKWLTGSWSPLFGIIDCAGKRWLDMFVPDSPGLYRPVALDDSMPGIVPASLNRICAVEFHRNALHQRHQLAPASPCNVDFEVQDQWSVGWRIGRVSAHVTEARATVCSAVARGRVAIFSF